MGSNLTAAPNVNPATPAAGLSRLPLLPPSSASCPSFGHVDGHVDSQPWNHGTCGSGGLLMVGEAQGARNVGRASGEAYATLAPQGAHAVVGGEIWGIVHSGGKVHEVGGDCTLRESVA